MKAIQYQAYGSYEENRLVEVDCPKPKDGEVLVKMSTVGINPLDNTFRSGHIYLATPANVPRVGGVRRGAGVVVESRHPAHQAGDRVFVGALGWGLVTDGTWREYVAATAAAIPRIPANIDDDVAAAYLAGAGYLPGYLASTEFAKLQPGQTVLAPAIGCRRDGNPSGCPPPRRIDDDLHREYYAKGRAGTCRRLRACHRPVQREHERRCAPHH
jgi:NADPH:quinone reductase-like Zn-dependent oxidoreductase